MKELTFEVLTGVELGAISNLADTHFDVARSRVQTAGLEHGLLLNFAAMPLTVKPILLGPPASAS